MMNTVHSLLRGRGSAPGDNPPAKASVLKSESFQNVFFSLEDKIGERFFVGVLFLFRLRQ